MKFNNYNEFYDLLELIQTKIKQGKLAQNKNGLYRMSKKFEDCPKTIYVYGNDAYDLAYKIMNKKEEMLTDKVACENMYFYKIAQEWYAVRIKGVGLAKKNVENHKSLLNNHILPAFKNCDMREIKNSEVQAFLNDKANQYSVSTVKKMKNIISAIFNYAEDNNYIVKSPVRRLTMPKCKKFDNDSKNPVREDELKLALKATKNNLMMQVIISMLYVYGLRTCELVNLKWENVNFEEDYFRIEKSKYTDAISTVNAEATKRYLPLSPKIKELLLLYKKDQDQCRNIPKGNFIFIKKNIKRSKNIECLDTSTLDGYFETLTYRDMEIANGAKVFNNHIVTYTGVRHFTPYAFRKGVVTRLNAMNYNDAITQMFVGHKPKEVKDKYYSKLNFEKDLRESFKKYMDETETVLCRCFDEI